MKKYIVFGIGSSFGSLGFAAGKEGADRHVSVFSSFGNRKKEKPSALVISGVMPTQRQSKIPFLGLEEIEPLFAARTTVEAWIKDIPLPYATLQVSPDEKSGRIVVDIYTEERRLALLDLEMPTTASEAKDPLYEERLSPWAAS